MPRTDPTIATKAQEKCADNLTKQLEDAETATVDFTTEKVYSIEGKSCSGHEPYQTLVSSDTKFGKLPPKKKYAYKWIDCETFNQHKTEKVFQPCCLSNLKGMIGQRFTWLNNIISHYFPKIT